MTSFTGFDDFIEIFRGGPVTDNRGRPHDGDRLIDLAVATFDPAHHEPPACVGHPTDNAPAFGWVRELKSEATAKGRVLMARFGDVVPEFADLVRRGVYKKRSAAFYPDGRLRHVGFLGAAPPAIKGLADIGFEDGGDAIMFIEDDNRFGILSSLLRRLREYFIERDGQDAADRVLPNWDIDWIGQQPVETEEMPVPEYAYTDTTGGGPMKFSEFLNAINIFKKMGGKDEDIDLLPPTEAVAAVASDMIGHFTEADIEAAKLKAAEDALAKAKAEFAEHEAIRKRDARKATVKQFIDYGVADGTIAPAWVKAGLAEFMEALADGDAIAFAEGETKTPDAWFREFLEGLPKLIDFGEVATRDKDVGGKDAGSQLDAFTQAKMEKRPELTYGAAFSEVQREHPELAAEYAKTISG